MAPCTVHGLSRPIDGVDGRHAQSERSLDRPVDRRHRGTTSSACRTRHRPSARDRGARPEERPFARARPAGSVRLPWCPGRRRVLAPDGGPGAWCGEVDHRKGPQRRRRPPSPPPSSRTSPRSPTASRGRRSVRAKRPTPPPRKSRPRGAAPTARRVPVGPPPPAAGPPAGARGVEARPCAARAAKRPASACPTWRRVPVAAGRRRRRNASGPTRSRRPGRPSMNAAPCPAGHPSRGPNAPAAP